MTLANVADRAYLSTETSLPTGIIFMHGGPDRQTPGRGVDAREPFAGGHALGAQLAHLRAESINLATPYPTTMTAANTATTARRKAVDGVFHGKLSKQEHANRKIRPHQGRPFEPSASRH
jgi:hypothetical protein